MVCFPATQCPQGSHKHFLRHIFCILALAQHSPAKTENRGLEPFDE
jgi:hypothetical protein